MKFIKKGAIVTAVQWMKMDDHPDVKKYEALSDDWMCNFCHYKMSDHGIIETEEGPELVCVGDWIINDSYVMPDAVLKEKFDEIGS